ncbi:MAG: peptidoglycan DD-metalloendopeptidase family protein [Pseudomonadota bacterium]
MKHVHLVLCAGGFILTAACGSHRTAAPVVYGTDPGTPSRIYNSPSEPVRPVVTTAPSSSQSSAPAASLETAPMKPVTAIYLADEQPALVRTSAVANRGVTGARIIRVQKGDTVYALGRRYNADPKSIIALNSLRAPYQLSIGQPIKIPGDGPATTAAQTRPAPVQNIQYTVRKGDTLYSIARKSGASVASIATANGIRAPYTISPGQRITVPGGKLYESARVAKAPSPAKKATAKSAYAPKTQPAANLTKQVSFTPTSASSSMFDWPVRGKIISEFGVGELGRRNDGINIAAPSGTPVRAAADGEVVYRGAELDGFGNLLLVKHADGFVTAYAHNDAMIAKKGDRVRKGQVIAKVGQTGAVSTPQLHFEIRQKLKSVDPVALLETN